MINFSPITNFWKNFLFSHPAGTGHQNDVVTTSLQRFVISKKYRFLDIPMCSFTSKFPGKCVLDISLKVAHEKKEQAASGIGTNVTDSLGAYPISMLYEISYSNANIKSLSGIISSFPSFFHKEVLNPLCNDTKIIPDVFQHTNVS